MYLSFVLSALLGTFLNNDKNESIFLASVSMASLVFLFKLCYVIWLQNDLCTFIETIGVHSLTDENDFHQINEKINSFMKFVTIFIIMTFLGYTPILIVSLPIFTNERKLPVNCYFPFDWKSSEIAYWTAYFHIVISYLFSILCIIIPAIIWFLMMNCSIKYESLGSQFKNLGIKGRTISKENEQNAFLQELIDLVNTHRNLQK